MPNGDFMLRKEDLKYKDFLSSDMHLRTNIIDFEGKFYFPDELIPYQNTNAKIIENFKIYMEWADEEELFEGDYDEVYNSIEQLWTEVRAKISANEDMNELGIVAQIFVKEFTKFLDKLKQNNQAVYNNEEYSPFKWLAWIKEDKVRIIQQDYRFEKVKTEFDVLIDKKQFFNTCNYMLQTMQEYANKGKKRYENYVKEKYKR